MVEEASLEFRLRKIYETRNHLLDEIKHNDLMSKKPKKAWKHINYFEHLLILAFIVAGCVSICIMSLCSCWCYGFWSRIEHLCNHCRN